MRTRLGFSVLSLVLASGCTANTFSSADDAGGDGGVVHGGGDDAGTDAKVPPGCDATKLPTDYACVINDAEGIFVSSSLGGATGDGTRAHPMSSLEAGLAAAAKSSKRVYACAESYAEAINFQNGVDVFGYFDCTDWSASTAHAKVQAPTSPASKASDITKPTRVFSLDIIAPDFTTGSQSSIGLIANNSSGLHFIQGKIHAGTGGKGADGTDAITQTDDTNHKNGGNAWPDGVCTQSPCMNQTVYYDILGGTNTCSQSGSPGVGGTGGYGGAYVATLGHWTQSGQGRTDGNAASSQTAQGGLVGNAPTNGSNGADGTDGASAGPVGTLSAIGYTPADGSAGSTGAGGQGGGGSAGATINNSDFSPNLYNNDPGWGEPGPSGGAGGCPGVAGTNGHGGGASIAVVAVGSAITLDTVTVEASSGGAGGRGGLGGASTTGGLGGKKFAWTYAGGNGGEGGQAGISGSGGGGPSIGIAWQGAQVQLLACKVTPGAGGLGVPPQAKTSVKTIPASADGLSKDVYAF